MPKAREIMTTHPTVCTENASIYEVVEIMKRLDTGVVPIVDDENCCCGIITDRDIVLKVILEGLDPKITSVKTVMSLDLMTCHPEDDIDDILIQMERKQIKRMPVVNDEERCIGIISEQNIVLRHRNPGKLFEFASHVYDKKNSKASFDTPR